MKTPTKHSDEVPIATECVDSSAKIDSKSDDASELMVADMLSQMVRTGSRWYSKPSIQLYQECSTRLVYVCMVSYVFGLFVSCCFAFYRKKTFENLAIRSWIE